LRGIGFKNTEFPPRGWRGPGHFTRGGRGPRAAVLDKQKGQAGESGTSVKLGLFVLFRFPARFLDVGGALPINRVFFFVPFANLDFEQLAKPGFEAKDTQPRNGGDGCFGVRAFTFHRHL